MGIRKTCKTAPRFYLSLVFKFYQERFEGLERNGYLLFVQKLYGLTKEAKRENIGIFYSESALLKKKKKKKAKKKLEEREMGRGFSLGNYKICVLTISLLFFLFQYFFLFFQYLFFFFFCSVFYFLYFFSMKPP